jgi:hypothetical protein
MGGSAGGGGQRPGGGAPSQMPAPAQGTPSSPGIGQGPQGPQGPLGRTGMPQLQDWRTQMQNQMGQGQMPPWMEQLQQYRQQGGQRANRGHWGGMSRPQYSGGAQQAMDFRGGSQNHNPITNSGSFSAAQTGTGGPSAEITAPAAVAGAPSSGQGGNATPGQPGQSTPQPGGNSAAIVRALRGRMGR